MIANSRCASWSVREDVGSSMITTRASPASARAMATSCRLAVESSRTGAPTSSSTPSCSKRSRACARIAAQSSPRQARRGRGRPTKRFSATVSSGNRSSSWGIIAIPARSASRTEWKVTSRPSTFTRPSSGRW